MENNNILLCGLIILLILIAIFNFITKENFNVENMKNLKSIETRMKNHYEQIGENVIYSRDFIKMYEIGNFYFTINDYEKMAKYYRFIIDEYNKYNKLHEDPIFINRCTLNKLYLLVQHDMNMISEKQLDCEDYNNCLNTNLVLPVIV